MVTESLSDHAGQLNRGEVASRNLNEILKIDFNILLKSIVPDMALPNFGKVGISTRMQMAGRALHEHIGIAGLKALQTHTSDTVRGFAIYGLANSLDNADIPSVLKTVRPFAADAHFGVREWSWLAVRPRLVRDLECSIYELTHWSLDCDPLIRRFAVEALRPRGVWCKAIPALRADPSLGRRLLEPMRAEPERYPQDSVANWLNDAAKDHPEWVTNLCRDWLARSEGNPATTRIATRATRSIKRPKQVIDNLSSQNPK